MTRRSKVHDSNERSNLSPHVAFTNPARRPGFLGQVGLLLWKSLLHKRRSIWFTLAEICIPLLGAIILLIVRELMKVTVVSTPTTFKPLNLSSNLAAGNLTRPDARILYAPSTLLVNDLMKEVGDSLVQDGLKARVMGFATEQILETHYLSDNIRARNYSIAVIFKDVDETTTTWPTKVIYKLRPRSEEEDQWFTHRIFPVTDGLTSQPDDKQLYYSRGFLYTQLIVNKALIRQLARNGSLKSYLWQINGMPVPPFIGDGVIHALQQYFSVIIMLSFIFSVIVMSKNIVFEKEKQLKESMKLMGLSTSAYWTAWFLQFLTFLLIACVVYTILLSIRIGKSSAILAYSNPAVVFLFFLSYSISVITFCFFMSTLFTKANIAASVSGIVFFAAFFPQVLLRVQYDNMPLDGKLAVSLLFNTAMSLGAHYITLYEENGQGVQWRSFTESPSIDDNFTLKHVVVMLVVDAVIFAILAWYLENVHPGDYGVPRPWFFPFQLSYWCDVKERQRSSTDVKKDHKCARNFEFEPPDAAMGIRIVNLSKMREGAITALRNVTLNIHEGQITALLGHTGAGKTTIMSVLTGFIRPKSGTAIVNGYDIRTDIDQVRKYLGLCPEHDVLFDYLTVDEHLSFFAMLKGCPKSEIEPLIKEMAEDIGLESTRNTLSRCLSRVQKRKLSIAIALIGGSKVVLLDEPTLGMDPAARHQVWRVLQRYRAGRTILMCTNSLDEAVILGDRIAIMAEGVIKCCGTSMFLKKRYGAGYNLVIIKDHTNTGDAIIHTVQSMIKSAVLESDGDPEIIFLLPEDKTADFPSLFNMLETRRKTLGISSFDVNATTMEEVFLKVGASGYLDAESRRQSFNFTLSSESSSNVNTFSHNHSRNLMSTEESSSTVMQSRSNLNINQSADNLNSLSRSKSKGERSILGFEMTYLNLCRWADNPLFTVTHLASPLPYWWCLQTTCYQSPCGRKDVCSEWTQHSSRYIVIWNKKALNEDFEHLSSVKLHMSRFYGIIVKKAIHTFRNRIFSILQFLLPVICTIAALAIYKVQEQESDHPCLPLQLDMFGDDTISAVGTGLNPSVLEQELVSSYIKLFEGAGVIQTIPRMQYKTVNDYYLGQAAKLGRFIYNTKVMIGAEFQSTADNKTIIATAWYSTHLYHTRPIALAYLTNAVLQKETRNILRSISTINHPMPKTTEGIVQDTISENLRKAFPIGFVIMFGMSFLTASFSYFLIRERKTGSKHLQVISGVGPLTFWLANFAWDLINYFIPCLAMLVIFSVFKVDAYTENGNLTFVLLLLVSFGSAVLPYTYVLQTIFTKPATGFVVLLSQAFVSGLFTMLIVFVLRVPSLQLENMAFLLDWLFMVLFPHYAFGVSLSYILIKNKESCGRTCLENGKNYLAWDYPGVGRNIFVMSLQSVVFFALIVIIEYQLPKKLIYICKSLHPTALRRSLSIGTQNYLD